MWIATYSPLIWQRHFHDFNLTQPMRVATRYLCRTKWCCYYFNLTQPVRVATVRNCLSLIMLFQSNATRVDCDQSTFGKPMLFQSNATRVGCNNKLAQAKQQVVIYFVQCLSAFWPNNMVRYYLLQRNHILSLQYLMRSDKQGYIRLEFALIDDAYNIPQKVKIINTKYRNWLTITHKIGII